MMGKKWLVFFNSQKDALHYAILYVSVILYTGGIEFATPIVELQYLLWAMGIVIIAAIDKGLHSVLRI